LGNSVHTHASLTLIFLVSGLKASTSKKSYISGQSFRRFGNSKEPCSCFVFVLWEGIEIKSVEDLDVFKLAHQLALKTYSTTKTFQGQRRLVSRTRCGVRQA
jgi:hypothetical protein